MKIPRPHLPDMLKRFDGGETTPHRTLAISPQNSAERRTSSLPSPSEPIPRTLSASALFTPEAMHRAWRSVKAAGGGPGVDGVTLQIFGAHLDEELETLRQSLIDGTYRPRQIRQIYVPKKHGGLRPLVIWTLRDRIAQRAVYDLIAPVFDAIFLPVSFGFRTGLGTADAVEKIVAHREQGLRWVVDADIKSCFEEINVARMEKLIRKRVRHPRLRQLIGVWLKAGAAHHRSRKRVGIPQGGVLSPLLANIYLHEFDKWMMSRHLALVRYADDFIICTRRKNQAQIALKEAHRALENLKLTINPHKTRITHFDQGFKFIGYFFVRNQVYRL